MDLGSFMRSQLVKIWLGLLPFEGHFWSGVGWGVALLPEGHVMWLLGDPSSILTVDRKAQCSLLLYTLSRLRARKLLFCGASEPREGVLGTLSSFYYLNHVLSFVFYCILLVPQVHHIQ